MIVCTYEAHHRDTARRPLDGTRARGTAAALVIAEVSYMVGKRLGSKIEAAFLRGLEQFDVAAPSPEEWVAIGDVVERYGDFPLGAADASAVVLAERLSTDLIVTLDRRHFG